LKDCKSIDKRPRARFKKAAPLLYKYRERSKSVGFDDQDQEAAASVAVTAAAAAAQVTPAATPAVSGGVVGEEVVRPKTKVSKWTRVKEAFRWEKAHVDAPAAKASTPAAPPSSAVTAAASSTGRPANSVGGGVGDEPVKTRRPLSALSTTWSSSSSSLSECPLESEILKSLADAQELPFFTGLQKRASSPELSAAHQQQQKGRSSARLLKAPASPSGHSPGLLRQSERQMSLYRMHRQSTVSCDGNFLSSAGAVEAPEPSSSSSSAAVVVDAEALGSLVVALAAASSSASVDEQVVATVPGHYDRRECVVVLEESPTGRTEDDEEEDQELHLLQPSVVVDWGAWPSRDDHAPQSLSVPSSPSRHDTFTFDASDASIATTDSPCKRSYAPSPIAPPTPATPAGAPENATDSSCSSTSFKKHLLLLLPTPSPEGASPEPPRRKSDQVTSHDKVRNVAKKVSEGGVCGVAAGACDWRDGDKRKNELPPAFKKKLAEWEIRKAVAGKSDQNVEDLQKILPHDFNRKLQEWERIKAAKPAAGATAGAAGAAGVAGAVGVGAGLERQGSASSKSRTKKGAAKSAARDQAAKVKPELLQRQKQKQKELQWLEKELQKIEREKQRLEREREKYVERETR